MPKTTLTALLLCLALAALLPGQTPAPASPPDRQLIEQLGDRDYSKRRQAEERLRAEGARALSALKQALNHPDAEVRRRVRELVAALQTQALLAPKRVTLKLTDRPVSEALEAIARQTGYKIDLETPPPGTYSFDLKGATFWEALDRVGREAGLVLRPAWSGDRFQMEKRLGHTAHVCRDGAFRFTADRIQLYRDLEYGLAGAAAPSPKRSEILTLSFTVFAEPKLPILGMGDPRLSAAYDTDKRSMLPPADPVEAPGRDTRNNARYGNLNRCFGLGTQVYLYRPSRTSAGIQVVRGTVPLTLLVSEKPVVVTDKLLSAKGKRAKVGTINFLFEDVTRRPGGTVQVKLTATKGGADGANDISWAETVPFRIEVQDEKGNAFRSPRNSGSYSRNGASLEIDFESPGGAKVGLPAKFIFRDWTTREHLASFEFKELPLP